jgi:hypothetical protein
VAQTESLKPNNPTQGDATPDSEEESEYEDDEDEEEGEVPCKEVIKRREEGEVIVPKRAESVTEKGGRGRS